MFASMPLARLERDSRDTTVQSTGLSAIVSHVDIKIEKLKYLKLTI